MALTIIFAVSGLAIVVLLVAKKWGERRRRPIFLMRAISKGDIRAREFSHGVVHIYSQGKERLSLLFKKRVPMYSKNSLNKSISFIKNKRDRYIERLRDSRLLKKSDGISEFFKNMSDIEKGNGEIHDIYEDDSQKKENSQEEQKGLE